MTMQGKPAWVRQSLAVGLLIAGLAMLVAAAAAPFLMANDFKSEIESKDELLTALTRRAKDRDRLKSENDRLAAAGSQARALIEGESFGLASANLQKLLVENVQSAGLTLRSIQSLDPANDGDLTAVSVRLVCRGVTDGLRTLLHALESGEPLLFVDEVLIKSERSPGEEGTREGGTEISIELKVSGFTTGRLAP